MYTEDIKRHCQEYFTLANSGIFMHRLQGDYDPPGQSWTMEVSLVGSTTKYQAKAAIEYYLRRVYSASGITFLSRRSQPEHQFYVQFFRGDL